MKNWKYLKYIVRHKFFVFVAGVKIKASLWRLLIHDWSKLSPAEWSPYVRYFYGRPHCNCDGVVQDCSTCFRIRSDFDAAWLHHQHRNPHHWQYWLLREDSGKLKYLPMPEKYIREMVADWMGAGRAITGKWDVVSWYKKNRETIQLEENTRRRVEEFIFNHCAHLTNNCSHVFSLHR